MGVKGERSKPVATSEQLRLAQLTMEGNSAEESSDIQRLIKRVIETTRCTQAQAEIALFDNENDIAAAVDYILENTNVESWTEQKSKSQKKKEDVDERGDRRPVRGGGMTSRGRMAGGDRTRGGFSGAPPRQPTRGAPSGRGRGGRSTGDSSRSSRPVTDSSSVSVTAPDTSDESNDWTSGPMEFKRSDTASVSTSTSALVSAQPVISQPSVQPSAAPTARGPISFAAVAAAAAKKEEQLLQRQQQVQQAPSPATPQKPVVSEIPAQSIAVADISFEAVTEDSPSPSVHEESFQSEPSTTHCEPEVSPQPLRKEPSESLVETAPVQTHLHANSSWTTQLKNDLGIGVGSAEVSSHAQPSQSAVEFVSDAVGNLSVCDYQFGFVDAVPSNSLPPVNPPTSELFSTRYQQPVETERLSASELTSMKTSVPSQVFGTISGQGSRALSFADTSSISYAPTTDRSGLSKAMPSQTHSHQSTQPPTHQVSQNTQQPPLQSHQPPLFNPTQMSQLPYANNPYMNMNLYSPMPGSLDPYMQQLMQYPFQTMDFTSIMPSMSQAGPTGHHSSGQQPRADSHNVDMTKFSSQSRDSSSNVAPPPGFTAPPSFMQQPHGLPLSQQYMMPSFMMPNVGSAGRLYSQEEDRKSYDKMSGVKQAQATPPPHFQQPHYLGLNKKPYNWNN